MKYGIIYKYYCKITKKIYIGQTIQKFEIRKQQHLQKASDDFHQDLIKYGEDNFEISIIEDNIPLDKLDEREIYWIEHYKSYKYDYPDTGYNLTKGGRKGTKGGNHKDRTHSTPIDKIPDTAKPIKDAIDHWIDIDGSVYCLDNRFGQKHQLIKKVQRTVQGYKYCGIKYEQGVITKRVHRLVAETFIPNPDPEKLTVIGHRNNIKTDNRVENLYWTTIKENTQKAVDDGLMINDKGFDDNQSMPVKMYETRTNKYIATFGSIIEASKATGIGKSTIARQAKYKKPNRKEYYFRYIDDEDCVDTVLAQMDYDTEEIIKTFINVSQASKELNVPPNTIRGQLKRGKPKFKEKGRNYYFKVIDTNKCEQTIEN